MKKASFWAVLAFPFLVFGQKEAEKGIFLKTALVYSGIAEPTVFAFAIAQPDSFVFRFQEKANAAPLALGMIFSNEKNLWQHEIELLQLQFSKKNNLIFSNSSLPIDGSEDQQFLFRIRAGASRRFGEKAAFLLGSGGQGFVFHSFSIPLTSQNFPVSLLEMGLFLDAKAAFSAQIGQRLRFETAILWPFFHLKTTSFQIQNPNFTFAQQHQNINKIKFGGVDRAVCQIGLAVRVQ